jgi:flagellar motor switch protein FliM
LPGYLLRRRVGKEEALMDDNQDFDFHSHLNSGSGEPVVRQEELDTLVTALQSVSQSLRSRQRDKPVTVSLFDFRDTIQLSTDQLRMLETEAQSFCRVLRRTLVPYLNTEIDLQLLSIGVASFDQLVRAFPSVPVIGVFRLSGRCSLALWEITPTLAFAVVELMLGATEPVAHPTHEVTSIESAVLSRFLGELLSTWTLTSPLFQDLSPQVEYVTSSVAKIDMREVEQNMVHMVFKAQVGKINGVMNVGLPVSFLRGILRNGGHGETPALATTTHCDLPASVRKVMVDVSVRLPSTRVPMALLHALRPGDVLPLGVRSDSNFVIAVSNRPKFVAEPGLSQGHLAARIVGLVD